MQKFLKKFAAIFAAALAVVCLAVFAVACDKGGNGDGEGDGNNGGGYATTTFTVIVKDENGNPIDGTSDIWENDNIPGMPYNAQVQFCSVTDNENNRLGTCNNPVAIGADGKAVIDLEGIRVTAEAMSTNLFELHICNVECQGYTKGEYNAAYGRYEVDKIPLVIEVTLKFAADFE